MNIRTLFVDRLMEADYTQAERQRYATIRRPKKGGGWDYKFPIGDAHHARLAIRYLDSSDLSAADKAKVIAKASRFLGKAKVQEMLAKKGKS